MDNILTRVMHWFHPAADVPEEEDRHKLACAIREEKAAELRAKLQTDPDLEARLNNISNLLNGVK